MTHISQQHDLDVTYRIDHCDCPGPAGMPEGCLTWPAMEVVVAVRSPTQPVSRAITIRGEKPTLHIGGEVLSALVHALVGHQLQQHPQIVSGGEQPCMPRHPRHGVKSFLVLDLPTNSLGTDEHRTAVRTSAEVDIAVPGVTVQLGRGNEVGGRADVKWPEFSPLEPQAPINALLEIFVEAFTDDLLDDQAKDHIVDVAIRPLGVRCIHERCTADPVDHVGTVRDVVEVLQV